MFVKISKYILIHLKMERRVVVSWIMETLALVSKCLLQQKINELTFVE
jgi:hypothetical protein